MANPKMREGGLLIRQRVEQEFVRKQEMFARLSKILEADTEVSY